MALTDRLTAIANAIRGKTGGTEKLTLEQMVTEIEGIETGGGEDLLEAKITGTLTEYENKEIEILAPYAFAGCEKLETVNLPNVKSLKEYTFYLCKKLKSFSNDKITRLGIKVLSECSSLESVNTPNVTEIESGALSAVIYPNYVCTSLDFPLVTTVKGDAFCGYKALKNVNLPLAKSLGGSVFGNCTALESVSLPSVISASNYLFQNCTALKTVDFAVLPKTYHGIFSQCTSLKNIILRNESAVVSLYDATNVINGTPFASGGTGGRVFVPSALIEEYKNATNWSILVGYGTCEFLALEDYTLDGTTTGELDESKI